MNRPTPGKKAPKSLKIRQNKINKNEQVSDHSHAENVREGDVVAVTIKRLGINGEGVGYYKRKALFISGALPGEVVKVRITQIAASYLKGELLQIEQKSRHRINPSCPVYVECGGCQLLHMNYAGQLAEKREMVKEAFARYMGMEVEVRPAAGMKQPWNYRNKAQLQTSYHKGQLLAGLYSPGSHKLVDISGCKVQHPAINETVRNIKKIAEELQIPVYDERKHSGHLRTIIVRTGFETGELQITLVTATPSLPRKEELIKRIRNAVPRAGTIAQNINRGDSPLIFGEKTIILWGKEQIAERLGRFTFMLSPRAFFQLNPTQAEVLYRYALDAAGLSGKETVIDAYCGTGTISLWLADRAKEVLGIEAIPEAVDNARMNADLNHISNVRFTVGKAEEILPRWIKKGIRPDVVVVDPPRTGCDANLLRAIVDAKPKRMVYISCNPSTLAKDCRYLHEHGYEVKWAQPVDMFPHTSHVECVAQIVLK